MELKTLNSSIYYEKINKKIYVRNQLMNGNHCGGALFFYYFWAWPHDCLRELSLFGNSSSKEGALPPFLLSSWPSLPHLYGAPHLHNVEPDTEATFMISFTAPHKEKWRGLGIISIKIGGWKNYMSVFKVVNWWYCI